MIKLHTCKVNFKINRIAYLQTYGVADSLSQSVELPFYDFVFVKTGSIIVNGKSYSGPLEQNDMILIPPFEPHSIINTDPEHKAIIIHGGFECPSKHLGHFTHQPYAVSLSSQDHLFKALKEISSISNVSTTPRTFIQKDDIGPFCAEQLLCRDLEYFFIMCIRKIEQPVNFSKTLKRQHFYKSELVPEILDYINKHIYENITITELCDVFQLNKSTLYKLFKESQGRTIIKYINQYKIQLAKNMIRTGNKNFTEIAEALSFSSIHYFCKVFIKYEHMTPTEYSKTITSYVENKRRNRNTQ